MAMHATFEFVTGGGGEFVSNDQMIRVVQDYIYQEKGVRVDIEDPGFDPRRKGLLLIAYEWAINRLR